MQSALVVRNATLTCGSTGAEVEDHPDQCTACTKGTHEVNPILYDDTVANKFKNYLMPCGRKYMVS